MNPELKTQACPEPKIQACPEPKIQACPDRQILSLYVDDELPSPWKEKFEAHLDVCTDCGGRMEKYKKLRKVMQEDSISVPAELGSRILEKAAAAGNMPIIAGSYFGASAYTGRRLWNRTVSLPIPAAAAAAVIFVFAAFLAVQGIKTPLAPQLVNRGVIADVGSDTQGILTMSDINDVLQYLSLEDTSDYVIIKLPETRNFSSTGEPALMKAADYPGRNAIR